MTRHRLDSDSFFRMAEMGIIGESEWIELIDGELIDMVPIGQEHEASVAVFNSALVRTVGEGAIVRPQKSLRLDRWSVPQPDLAIDAPVVPVRAVAA